MSKTESKSWLYTPVCQRLQIEHPIFSVGMGAGMAGPDLVAAVSNAGACGVLGMGGLPAPSIKHDIQQLRTLTDKPFGVNIILPLLEEGQIETCFEERVPLLVLFWGDAQPYIAEAHRRGTQVCIQVGAVDEAVAAADAGVDMIIAQGIEAGGHVKSTTSMSTLVPAIVDAVDSVPIIAAGGIANGKGVVAALSLGAQAVSMGTRFLASEEAVVTREYKERIVNATAKETLHTFLFDVGWPDAAHRVLRNRAVEEWEAAGSPDSGERPGEGEAVGSMPMAGTMIEVSRYSIFPPMSGFQGDTEYTALYAGESCSLIFDIQPAGQIVKDVVSEAEGIVKRMRG